MKKENQKLKTTINFVDVNGIGTVRLKDHTYRDVFIYGYFQMFRWWFIAHQDVEYPDYVMVSEASTGAALTDYCYKDVDSALRATLPVIEEKRYYFETAIGDILTMHLGNLLKRNIGSQTLAIDSTLW